MRKPGNPDTPRAWPTNRTAIGTKAGMGRRIRAAAAHAPLAGGETGSGGRGLLPESGHGAPRGPAAEMGSLEWPAGSWRVPGRTTPPDTRCMRRSRPTGLSWIRPSRESGERTPPPFRIGKQVFCVLFIIEQRERVSTNIAPRPVAAGAVSLSMLARSRIVENLLPDRKRMAGNATVRQRERHAACCGSIRKRRNHEGKRIWIFPSKEPTTRSRP